MPARGGTALRLALLALIAAGGLLLYRSTRPGAPQAAHLAAPPSLTRDAATTAKARPPLKSPSPAEAPPATAFPDVPAADTPRAAPFGTSEEVFEAGARLYTARCASCHGRPGHDGSSHAGTAPAAQFWKAGDAAARRSLSRSDADIYRLIAAGPAAVEHHGFARFLSDTEIWDLVLLLRSARDEMPDPVLKLLHAGA